MVELLFWKGEYDIPDHNNEFTLSVKVFLNSLAARSTFLLGSP